MISNAPARLPIAVPLAGAWLAALVLPLALALALALVLAPPARAGGAWSPPAAISGDGASRPRVVITDDAVAVAAWSGVSVQAATRVRAPAPAPAGGGSPGAGFAPAGTLAAEPGSLLDLVTDSGGGLTATWVTGEPAVDSAWGAAGGGFGSPVRFPFAGVPLVAAAPGDDAFYVWSENGRLRATRRHEGTFGAPRDAASGLGLAALAVDETGALDVVGQAGDGTVEVATGLPELGFGAPRALSAPGSSGVQAVTGERGDVLVAWTTPAGDLATAVRPAGADWGPPQTVPGSVGARQPAAAVDDEGNAILAWTDGARVGVSSRTAGAAWGPASRASTRPVCCTSGAPPAGELDPQVGFDGRGTALILWADGASGGGARTLRAAVRPPGGPVRPFETVATGTGLGGPDLAVDRDRNAIAVWTAGVAAGPTHVAAAAFDPSAPVITAFAPGSRARPTKPRATIPARFAYSVTDPASVTVDISSLRPTRRHLATLRSLGSSRAGRLSLSPRLAKRLARSGRYRATIEATTRGGREALPRHLDFRRVRRG